MAAAQPSTEELRTEIVTGILGAIIGIFLGVILASILVFAGDPWDVLILWILFLIAFATAYGFMRLCGRLDLTGKHLFRQSFPLLTPTLIVFVAVMVARAGLSGQVDSYLSDPQAIGAPSVIAVGHSTTTVLVFSVLFAAIIMTPFLLHARKEEPVRASWFWPFIIPIILCAATWWMVSVVVRNLV